MESWRKKCQAKKKLLAKEKQEYKKSENKQAKGGGSQDKYNRAVSKERVRVNGRSKQKHTQAERNKRTQEY